MKKVIAAPAYLHETLLHQLLDEQHTQVLSNVSVVPFSALLPRSTVSTSEILEQAYARIQSIKDACPHFTQMMDNPSFLKQLTDFRNEMAEYQIQLEDLPEEDDFQRELKQLIQSFYDLPTASSHRIDFLHSHINMNHVEVIPSYHSSMFDGMCTEHLLKSGAALKDISLTPVSLTGYTALNRRQEIEACAQHIISNNLKPEDINIVLCDSASDQKVLQLVFDRYGIPYGFVNSSKPSQIARLWITLVKFLQEKNLDTFIEYLHAGYHALEHFDALIHYLDLFVENPDELTFPFEHVQHIVDSEILMDDREVQKLIDLEKHAEEVREKIQIHFEGSIFVSAYEFCRAHALSQQPEERSVLLRIKEILEHHVRILDHPQYTDLICFEIQNLTCTSSSSFQHCVCVSDLTHPVLPRTHGYVLGCVQSSFPNFQPCSGIFDEDYVSKVKGYPLKTERQRFNAEQTSWIFRCANNIIFSASCADYEGKGRQMSVEISSRLGHDPVPWKLVQHHQKHKTDFTISADTAKKLFLRNGKLHGSISSFERWFHCPASYFLSYGLKLRDQKLPEFNIAMMGTLQHAVLEEVLSKYHKNIGQVQEEELIEIVDHIFNPVIHLFKKQRTHLTVTKHRCIKNMTQIFEFLGEMEQNTDFEPYAMEKHFKMTLLENEDVPVAIQGIIDRIDMTHDMLRILDYKSSHKTLSVTKAQSGLQLQLLTYLYTASLLFQKTAAGCYYVSLKNDDIKSGISKVDGRKFVLIDPVDDGYDLWKQSHRLDGLTFENTDMLDFDGTHIKNFKNGKPSKIYSIDDLSGLITTIYHYLAEQVSSGNIALIPTEDACLFCETSSICRFRSLKVKSIVPPELTSHFFKEVKKS
ncbi:MAG: PD-(D/E)XK nuclease family protein [Erysipelotrichaceae bacterium]|nr:PD-(D/E)XK nuclease family protein [Erysipelotrichaceae bacterium]